MWLNQLGGTEELAVLSGPGWCWHLKNQRENSQSVCKTVRRAGGELGVQGFVRGSSAGSFLALFPHLKRR